VGEGGIAARRNIMQKPLPPSVPHRRPAALPSPASDRSVPAPASARRIRRELGWGLVEAARTTRRLR